MTRRSTRVRFTNRRQLPRITAVADGSTSSRWPWDVTLTGRQHDDGAAAVVAATAAAATPSEATAAATTAATNDPPVAALMTDPDAPSQRGPAHRAAPVSRATSRRIGAQPTQWPVVKAITPTTIRPGATDR